MMDTTRQLHALEATGWQAGLYEDVQRTFRAPVVNWIFRTAMANEPAFTRFAWGQVKPVFETRAFADLTVAYRDAVLSALEAEGPLPTYRRVDASVSPAEYAELRGQLATFDVVAPRLAVLFEVLDRALHDREVGGDPATGRAATAPFPEHLDRDRGRPPTMVDEPPAELSETVDRIRAFHGFGDSLPSIYRCLAQRPTFTERLWTGLEPRFESAAFDDACERTGDLVDDFVEATPYRPQLSPAVLAAAGFDEETITDAQELFAVFNAGPVETVLPALPVFAATVGSEGERSG
jgi:hypothetical protein